MRTEEILKLKMQFQCALNSIGHSLIKEEFAYKLLAWLAHYGHYDEVVTNFGLCSDILIAQKLLGVNGGDQVKHDVLIKLKTHIEQGKDASFMPEIFVKYNIIKKN